MDKPKYFDENVLLDYLDDPNEVISAIPNSTKQLRSMASSLYDFDRRELIKLKAMINVVLNAGIIA